MRRYRRNADVDLRRLERAAARGDLEAQDQLLIERIRLGRITYPSMVVLNADEVLG